MGILISIFEEVLMPICAFNQDYFLSHWSNLLILVYNTISNNTNRIRLCTMQYSAVRCNWLQHAGLQHKLGITQPLCVQFWSLLRMLRPSAGRLARLETPGPASNKLGGQTLSATRAETYSVTLERDSHRLSLFRTVRASARAHNL